MLFNLRATRVQRAQHLRKIGCAIVSTATPALSASYDLDDDALSKLGDAARDAAAGLGLPRGAATFPWLDSTKTAHLLTSAQLLTLYKALRDYQAQLQLFAAGGARPSQPVTIA